MGEHQHIGVRVGARKASPGTSVALSQRGALTAAFDQPGELLARIATDPFQEAQHHGLLAALQVPVAESSHGAGDEFIALPCRHREIHRHGPVQKALQIR